MIIAFALLGFACDEEQAEKPEVQAQKAQCRDLLKHIVSISPQLSGQSADQVTADLPIEDVMGCVASEPEIRACMLAAADIATVRGCIPANDVLGCMQAAAEAKDAAHAAAAGKPVDDKPYDDIRARCWTEKSAKAAADLAKLTQK
jgi:hypothetical protein